MQQMALTLAEARYRGEIGMQRAASANDRHTPQWSEGAMAALLRHVQTIPHTASFIAEDIRLAVESKLPKPKDNRVWGSLTKSAAAKGYIVATGDYAPAKSSNASPKRLYRRGGEV